MKLERETIIDAAVRLLDEVGLDGLSMRRLAKELGVQAPALYWHFENKQALLDHMVAALSTEELRVPAPGQAWDDWLFERTKLLYERSTRHRDGARLAIGTRPTPAVFPGIEAMIGVLVAAGFTPGGAARGIVALSNFVTGSALEQEASRDRPENHGEAGGDDRSFTADDPALSDYPLLRAAAAEGVEPEAVFEHGLRMFIAGLRATVEQGKP